MFHDVKHQSFFLQFVLFDFCSKVFELRANEREGGRERESTQSYSKRIEHESRDDVWCNPLFFLEQNC